jgi:type II secretory ATPase GspE/PulE/Tfp pilus assembly ATPase PilB-like protein
MDPYILDQVRRFAQLESSMILVCGPTGSGKTTSVYALLQEMNHLTKNIVTVEDPVEYKLEHVTQIQVNPHADVTFVSALRSLLRQDPDIILIGEIRDPETAHLAVRSAMTGHAVLSTVHARDSIGCILRLLDLGVEPFLLASALTAVLSQRLLRKLCEHCKMRFRPAARLLTQNHLEELVGQELYSAVGCSHCMGIGYRGRLPIFEMLPISDQLREAISKKPGVQELRIAGGDWIRQTLREDAVRKIRDGLTSIDEFAHLSGRD